MLLPSSNERVVGRIFRLLCVAEDEASQSVRVVKACLDQLLERGSPCSLGIRRKGPTGVAQLTLSNSGPSPVPTHEVPKTFIRIRQMRNPRPSRAPLHERNVPWKPGHIAIGTGLPPPYVGYSPRALEATVGST